MARRLNGNTKGRYVMFVVGQRVYSRKRNALGTVTHVRADNPYSVRVFFDGEVTWRYVDSCQIQDETYYRRDVLNEGDYAPCGHAAPQLACPVCMDEWRRQERDGNAARDYGIFNG
jgi:hypothetical protein